MPVTVSFDTNILFSATGWPCSEAFISLAFISVD